MSRKRILIIMLAAILAVSAFLGLQTYRGQPKLIAFTFDDGPSPYTEALLDGLGERHVTVTFFMNGENGTGGSCGIKNGHEALLDRMWEDGHQLANHTYSHGPLHEMASKKVISEVSGVEDLIFDAAGGEYECFVRTPGGHVTETIQRNVHAPIVLWSLDTEDWKYRDADHVYSAILSCVKSGDIVLMHDIYESSVEGALRAVDTLKEQGYEFVTVAELMRRTGVSPTDGTAYSEGKQAIFCRPAYSAPAVAVSEAGNSEARVVTCSADAGLTIHYTLDGTYPRLSDSVYSGTVIVEAGTVFTAVGVDRWGTRTSLTTVTAS